MELYFERKFKMKRSIIITALLLLVCLSAFAVASNSVTYSIDNQKKGRITFTATADLNDLTFTSRYIEGILNRIVINSTGTETDWTVILKDDLGATLFTKADCNSVLDPYSYAITATDTAGNLYYGSIVSGPLTLEIKDVNSTPETQTIAVTNSGCTPDAGNYTITYGGQTTGNIASSATTSAIDTAIEALSAIGTGNVAAVASTGI